MASCGSSVPAPGEGEAAPERAEAEEAEDEEEQEVVELASRLRQLLRGWEAPVAAVQRLLVWERPPQSLAGAVALGAALWWVNEGLAGGRAGRSRQKSRRAWGSRSAPCGDQGILKRARGGEVTGLLIAMQCRDASNEQCLE